MVPYSQVSLSSQWVKLKLLYFLDTVVWGINLKVWCSILTYGVKPEEWPKPEKDEIKYEKGCTVFIITMTCKCMKNFV